MYILLNYTIRNQVIDQRKVQRLCGQYLQKRESFKARIKEKVKDALQKLI